MGLRAHVKIFFSKETSGPADGVGALRIGENFDALCGDLLGRQIFRYARNTVLLRMRKSLSTTEGWMGSKPPVLRLCVGPWA